MLSTMVRGFSKMLASAGPSLWKSGLAWYGTAHTEARRIAVETGVPFMDVCRVIACVSPATEWNVNLLAARNIIRHWKAGGLDTEIPTPYGRYYRNAKKAMAILEGKAALDPKTAPKTFAFFHNIFDPTNAEHTTFDYHMYRAAFGPTLWSEYSGPIKLSATMHETAKAALVAVASDYGILPLQAQAIIWERVKHLSDAGEFEAVWSSDTEEK